MLKKVLAAAVVALGVAALPFAAEAKMMEHMSKKAPKHHHHKHHHAMKAMKKM